MKASDFILMLNSLNVDFYTGVPDSLLAPFIDEVVGRYGISDKHIVAANEGAAVGLAAGHYLATGRPAVVYMQNSGIGNSMNPICSLLHEKVYSIPVIFVIGWRGEPGVKDEPQHIFQGEATLQILDDMEIPYAVVSEETNDLSDTVESFKQHVSNGKSVAFVIRKNALSNENKHVYTSEASITREAALEMILNRNDTKCGNVYICTTGKLSREVFEIREKQGVGHSFDFLTVGSMGHSLMIAQAIALSKPNMKVFCLDGDGAALMHLGSLAVAGVHGSTNLIHIVFNNGAHETVGGVPTVCARLNLSKAATSLGYKFSYQVTSLENLLSVMKEVKDLEGPVFIEIICNLDSRGDLGRPTTTPIQNKNDFMEYLQGFE
jgi:phosphonopyruvate decarboxylase